MPLCLQMTPDELYMQRCFGLALLGKGSVAPNPLVGAVLVHESRIIGEGFHRQFGMAHAEVECINSVKEAYRGSISDSVLYVSLEPCAHFGKTPPCTDLILKHGIRKVVIGCIDPFAAVDGKGVSKLKAAGVEVILSSLKKEALELNKRFFTFHTKKRPYVLLKWAQTGDGKISGKKGERLQISNAYANRLVHRIRSREAAIMVGTNTAAWDDPALTTRLWPGNNATRIVLDFHLRLPAQLQLFTDGLKTVVLNRDKNETTGAVQWYKLDGDLELIPSILKALYSLNLQSVLIEGGAQLLQSFIDAGLWDEAVIITAESLFVGEGISAPQLKRTQLKTTEQLGTDRMFHYQNIN